MEDAEKPGNQDREALIKHILEELDRDALAKEIITRLHPPTKKNIFLDALKHPVVLLILGFALTGIVGNWLASFWQNRQWERQQLRQIQLKDVETKYALIDELTRYVEKNNVAGRDVYGSCCVGRPELDESSYKDTITKLEVWGTAIDSWRSYSPILERKITLYFRDPEIHKLFKEIRVIGLKLKDIYNSLKRLYKDPEKNREELEGLRDFMSARHTEFDSRLGQETTKLADLIQIMNKEIQADIKSGV
ncbi:MAG TPA: hypothetical protein VF717_01270 [Pyrinomonadaceae bacterium]|jgi:hypothetical protein